jgi:hypothetical protein
MAVEGRAQAAQGKPPGAAPRGIGIVGGELEPGRSKVAGARASAGVCVGVVGVFTVAIGLTASLPNARTASQGDEQGA